MFGYRASYLFMHPVELAQVAWEHTRWAYQRVSRGWDDPAAWDIPEYLNEKMPAMLRRMQASKQGIPGALIRKEDSDSEGSIPEEIFAARRQEWEQILETIVAGFVAADELHNEWKLPFYQELNTLIEVPPVRDWFDPVHRAQYDAVVELLGGYEELRRQIDERQQIFERGMALFVEHYFSLWD